MQIAQALRQTTKPFVSLEFFPPAAESHLPEFYETYGIRPGDGMWTEPESRVSVW